MLSIVNARFGRKPPHAARACANVPDRAGAKWLRPEAVTRHPCLNRVWADRGYTGPCGRGRATRSASPSTWCTRRGASSSGTGSRRRRRAPGFCVLPRRWVVERTFAWLGYAWRLSKDYERLPETSEAMIYGAMSRLMLRRLTGAAA